METFGQCPATLTRELIDAIDQIELDVFPALTETEVIDLRLTHGSVEAQDGLEEALDEHLQSVADSYIAAVGGFICSSPDNGLPLHYQGERPAHAAEGISFSHWLQCAQQHLPGAEDEILGRLVDTVVDEYDEEGFSQALELVGAMDDGPKFSTDNLQWKMYRDAYELAESISGYLGCHA